MINRYTVFHENPHKHYVKLMFEAKVTETITEVCLPLWRPGRYELQNYAKNIKNFVAQDELGNELTYKKIAKSTWHIYTIGAAFIRITYEYYAHVLDAGASFFNHTQLYLNPCNCMLYIAGRELDICELHLKIPEDYQVAISLPTHEKNVYAASDFHTLADSPFVASPTLKHCAFEINHSKIHLWFQGDFVFDESDLMNDFKKYSEYQINIFGELPSRNYHYIFQMLPTKFHHGVEHSHNTVIAMGPDKNFDKPSFYEEFLGISSHEFFHLWNVKRIRPEEMWPYNYAAENYSALGWIYEGVTTYYGDMALLRSGVFSFSAWAAAFKKHLQKHFHNQGRYSYSVAQSSYDTWLDGYTPGAPGRKVSIYTEGLLAAFILDVYIMKCTENLRNLDDMMKELYIHSWQKQKGYSQEMYQRIAEQVCGRKLDWYFDNVINGCGYIEKYLPETFEYLGLKMTESAKDSLSNNYGLSYTIKEIGLLVNDVWTGSAADKAGVDEDFVITHLNGIPHHMFNLSETISGPLNLSGTIHNQPMSFVLQNDETLYFLEIDVTVENEQQANFKNWSSKLSE